MSCCVGCRCGSDQTWLRLWCRLAAAAQIRPLAWVLPYARVTPSKDTHKKKHSNFHQNSQCTIPSLLHSFFFNVFICYNHTIFQNTQIFIHLFLGHYFSSCSFFCSIPHPACFLSSISNLFPMHNLLCLFLRLLHPPINMWV